MKRVLSIVVLAAMLLSLTACGAPAASSNSAAPATEAAPAATEAAKKEEAPSPVAEDEVVELTLATSLYVEENHQITLDKMLEAYNALRPNIHVTIYGADYANFWNNMTTEIVSGQEADIIQMTPDYLPSYYSLREGGAFVDLDPYIAASGIDYNNILVGQDYCKIDGKNVGLADYAWGTTGIFYRKSILEKYGIDPASIVTSEDFVDALRKTTDGDNVGMGVVVGTHNFVYSEFVRMFSHAVSGFFFEDESEPYTADGIIVNSQENIDMCKWWQDLILKEKVLKPGPDKKDSRELFWNGLAAFNLDGPWFIGMTEARDPAVFDDMGLIPHVQMVYNGQTYKSRPSISPYLNAISSNCENIDAAWDFVSWMASPEAQEIAATCGMTPCNKEYSETEEYRAQYPLAAQFSDFVSNEYGPFMLFPSTDKYSELSQVAIDATQEMFSESAVDPKTALDNAAERMKEIMNK